MTMRIPIRTRGFFPFQRIPHFFNWFRLKSQTFTQRFVTTLDDAVTMLSLALGMFLVATAMAQEDCNQTSANLTDMVFQLDWFFNAQFAGVFLADRFGYFRDAGVSMTIKPWADGLNGVMEVAEGRADFACAEQNLILEAQAKGAPVKAVATMFQASPFGLMAPPFGEGSDIELTSLEALIGEDVGVHIDGLKGTCHFLSTLSFFDRMTSSMVNVSLDFVRSHGLGYRCQRH